MSASDDVITVQGKEYIKTKKLAEGSNTIHIQYKSPILPSVPTTCLIHLGGFAQIYIISRNGKQFVAKLQTIQVV